MNRVAAGLPKIFGIVIFLIIMICSNSFAQISGSNRIEYQIGNLPGESPSNMSNLYNQLNLFFHQHNFFAGAKIELFKTDNQQNSYSEFSQKFLRYRDDNFQIQIGNFYEALGRGLLLRAFDIPGTTYEDLISRQHYGFYQDIEGVSLRFNTELVQAKLLYGNPLDRIKAPALNRKEPISVIPSESPHGWPSSVRHSRAPTDQRTGRLPRSQAALPRAVPARRLPAARCR